MDKIETYRMHIKKLIAEYGKYKPSYGEIEVELIFDTEHDHYQLVNVGWHDQRRIMGCYLHIDIKNGKIWIQHNGTEDDIAEELVKSGVPKDDIVLGFHAPYKRKYTGYASN
ncbi:MAG: XisI protein [Desulfobacterales bacterium]|nr:XisI protein [Desulfobacterales bacterium]